MAGALTTRASLQSVVFCSLSGFGTILGWLVEPLSASQSASSTAVDTVSRCGISRSSRSVLLRGSALAIARRPGSRRSLRASASEVMLALQPSTSASTAATVSSRRQLPKSTVRTSGVCESKRSAAIWRSGIQLRISCEGSRRVLSGKPSGQQCTDRDRCVDARALSCSCGAVHVALRTSLLFNSMEVIDGCHSAT